MRAVLALWKFLQTANRLTDAVVTPKKLATSARSRLMNTRPAGIRESDATRLFLHLSERTCAQPPGSE
jgi:hypothetical protein